MTCLSRLATVVGKAGRPSILIDKNYKIWIGNCAEEPQVFSQSELFGFNTGSFEFKLVGGASKVDSTGLAWRLTGDMDLIAVEKKLVPLCRFLHTCATQHGLADMTLPEHDLTPKMHPAAPRVNQIGLQALRKLFCFILHAYVFVHRRGVKSQYLWPFGTTCSLLGASARTSSARTPSMVMPRRPLSGRFGLGSGTSYPSRRSAMLFGRQGAGVCPRCLSAGGVEGQPDHADEAEDVADVLRLFAAALMGAAAIEPQSDLGPYSDSWR